MTLKKIFYYLLIINFLIIVSPLISFGQVTADSSYLEMTMVPENPEPLQSVTISVKSLTYDLDRSKITWFVDGQQKKNGMGLKDFSIQAGKNGQKITIKAVIETQGSGTKEIEAFFIPSFVNLIYEARSYTPPFYKGRALNPSQGFVLVTAIPELITTTGEKIPTQNVIFSWKKDGKAQQPSGVGKNSFVFSGTIPVKDSVVEVTASSPDGNIYATKKITITNTSPKIIFYESNPVYGIMFNKGIRGIVNQTADEFKVKAFPYFMSVGYTENPDLTYKWMINGQASENLDGEKSAMLFRQANKGSGTALVSLNTESLSKIFQLTDSSFTINFQKQ